RAALWALAAVLAATGSISAWLIARSNVTLAPAGAVAAPDAEERRRLVFWQLWLVFFFAASAGLMVLSQAAGIITAYGGATTLAVYGTTFIAGMIAAARLYALTQSYRTAVLISAGANALGFLVAIGLPRQRG